MNMRAGVPALVLLLAAGCANGDRPIVTVELQPTVDNTTRGTITLMETDTGVRLDGEITGLEGEGGEYGFHVHEVGDCSAPDAESAGGHYAPRNQPHGDPREEAHHLGDMLNLEGDAGGVAQVDQHIDDATLRSGGATSLLGRALVIHANPDDYITQPDGNAGARLACGVIPLGVPES